MFVYFGCVFLEVLKAQISKANYQKQKHEFLPHDCVFKTYDFAGSLHLSIYLQIFTVLLCPPLSRFSPQLKSQILGHRVQTREAESADGTGDCL